ncbi:eukaryotic translation initiation factor 2-alpha kinase 1 isoform X2 [Gadus morhua]|uniref:Eukaryotic translation initiation factor 2-alpha kinase 1 n=1 Tax=Gadus morhua TaxID=8049 RepID=A0A8C5FGM5_GADMO|nr:eukaryotic translation initiation factor 2-alpha kinase 1 isoform X2 [Gadus morhua]
MDQDRENIAEMIARFIAEVSDLKNQEVLSAGKLYTSIEEFASVIPNHLLLGSLLEHLCFVYESDPKRSRMLFKVIGQRLTTMNLVSPLAVSDEFSTVRLQHNRAFTELLHAASSSLFPQSQQLLSADALGLPARLKESLFQAQTSRYLSEFEEIGRLGKGAYGKVFKVINKLDGQSYAVKKILIKNVSRNDCMKVLREVRMLSSMQHVCVVGYHTAWMEHVQPPAYPNSPLPALESPAPQFSGDESPGCSSNGSSIVFQSGSWVQSDPASRGKDAPGSLPPITALLPSSSSCPKLARRLPESYVPCVFLGQKAAAAAVAAAKACPALAWDGSALERDDWSGTSGTDRQPEPGVDPAGQQPDDKIWLKEVQFHLMLYIQMQLCERSLKDWISERNSRPSEELSSKCPYALVDVEHTLCLLRKTLEGVEYIHSKGMMHRDLKSDMYSIGVLALELFQPFGAEMERVCTLEKLREGSPATLSIPPNIFLHGQDSQVRIGDFGLACKDILVNDQDPLPFASNINGSQHTAGVGTFVYAAPEQLEGSYYNSKSDMYSIGVLALELFQPFGTEMERVRILENLREGTVPDSFSYRWPILAKYVTQLTSKDPGVRPTASQLLQSELFNSKDLVIHGLQRRVEEQEEEISVLRRQISALQISQSSPGGSDINTGH